MDEYLEHYGTPRHSGRYPWGSGKDPYQKSVSLLKYAKELRNKGMTEKEIATGLGFDSLKQYRSFVSIANSTVYKRNLEKAIKLKDKGWSNQAIADELGLSGESAVRSMLDPKRKERAEVTENIANALKETMESGRYIDLGAGTGARLGVSETKLNTAAELLQQEGYHVYTFKQMQQGTGKYTNIKVLVPPDVTFKDMYANRDKIGTTDGWSDDGGETITKPRSFVQVDSKRILIRYAEEGGLEKDGTIELRRGVEDISLGGDSYAQVRVGVDGTHYLKGMALYSDDIPAGYDIVYNTNKVKGTPAGKVFKEIDQTDADNPYGATVRQRIYIGSDGKEHLSALNIVGSADDKLNTEGRWDDWSKTLASQFLAKQPESFAKKQLKLAFDAQKDSYEEIMSLTNPAVRKQLLLELADSCDSQAVHLKGAALPRQTTRVLLPCPGLKDNEVYAPSYKNGEEVALVRYPHAGTFEIPVLRVNNTSPPAKKMLGQILDAVGINHNVADRLSGADFDGDTVIVLPTSKQKIKSTDPLPGLKDFDPKALYKVDHKTTNTQQKNLQMGIVSNLITDMTIKGASPDEIARAVRHSMVVIDSEKHNLDWKRSAIDNNISELVKKYQTKEDGRSGGASTLLSRSTGEERVPTYRETIDWETGKKVRTPKTGDTYVNKEGKVVRRTTSRPRMSLVDDAYELSSGSKIESVYADHANSLKRLGEQCRREAGASKLIDYSPSAAKTYAKEVASLKYKLNEVAKSKPLERQAQLVAGVAIRDIRKNNPDLDKDQLKKVRNRELATARARVGAKRVLVDVTPREWEAIQAGAIHTSTFDKIYMNSDKDQIKRYAMPKESKGLSEARIAQIRQLYKSEYTQAEIAAHLGLTESQVTNALKK